MPQVFKITRYQPGVFHQDQSWRRTLRSFTSLLWALFWCAVAVWILTGGAESRLFISGVVRGVVHFFRQAFSGMSWLLN